MRGSRKRRPPLRSSELHAYNYGRRARAEGLDAAQLLPLEGWPAVLALSAPELEALAGLGPDAFERWALRGWIEA